MTEPTPRQSRAVVHTCEILRNKRPEIDAKQQRQLWLQQRQTPRLSKHYVNIRCLRCFQDQNMQNPAVKHLKSSENLSKDCGKRGDGDDSYAEDSFEETNEGDKSNSLDHIPSQSDCLPPIKQISTTAVGITLDSLFNKNRHSYDRYDHLHSRLSKCRSLRSRRKWLLHSSPELSNLFSETSSSKASSVLPLPPPKPEVPKLSKRFVNVSCLKTRT
jgi:hypothetical protein